jgi:FRG domain
MTMPSVHSSVAGLPNLTVPTDSRTFTEYRLSGWEEFTAVAEALDGWAFRGQEDARWELVSLLTRRLRDFCPDSALWPLREERAMRIFRRKAHIYFQDRLALSDDLRCLALMQHHGAPTRLLDFTKSPFVAAFFAFERAVDDVAVYALNTPVLWSARPDFDDQLDREKIDPRENGNYERYFALNRHPLVWFGESSEMDSRLVAQSGVFVMPGVLDLPLDAILQRYQPSADLLRKYVLPASARADAMRALYRMNITHATLFPDLDGLARSIGYELEVVWSRLIDDYRARVGED